MKIVYLANAYGHISGPLCDELYKKYKDDFIFIETSELDEIRKKVGSKQEKPFIIKAKDDLEYSKKLCLDADVLIYGAAPFEFIKKRIKHDKITIYYSERLFKSNILRYLNPITIYNLIKKYYFPSKKKNVYLLCASSFAATDFNRIHSFKNKTYKWGYQPIVFKKNIDDIINNKPKNGLNFIWVGRLVKLKHCDDAIKTVFGLKKLGYNVNLSIIGDGPEKSKLIKLSEKLKLTSNVKFYGICPIKQTRELMDIANIFLFTSDYREGWGATLNECMNAGVACIASHTAGATNFLIKQGVNGLVYKSGNIKSLIFKSKFLIDNTEKRELIGKEAYNSIVNEWNPELSCLRLIKFIEEVKEKGDCNLYADGPCSKSKPLKKDWCKND